MKLSLRVANPDRGLNLEVAQFETTRVAHCYRCHVPRSLQHKALLQVYPGDADTSLYHLPTPQSQLVVLGLDSPTADSLCYGTTMDAHHYIYFAAKTSLVWVVLTEGPLEAAEALVREALL
jgi:hypothetical protein